MKKNIKKLGGMFLAASMLCSVIPTGIAGNSTVNAQAATSENEYGLLDNSCDGVILHCWNWSYTAIKNSMKDIAEAGYTSIQTSPVQMPKDASSDTKQTGWWKVYQPITLSMPDTHPWFGTKAEFKAMCDEAEKYGIKVIVDVVANHMANVKGDKGNCRADIYSENEATYRDDDSCWHLNGSTGIDYNSNKRDGSKSSLTHGFGGWPDLNTGSKKVQNAIINLCSECMELGADGFRFDAAKHIELPTDPGGASDFWPNVTSALKKKNPDVYIYGEILDDAGTSISNYTKYMAVTDNRAGNNIRDGVRDNNIRKASSSSLCHNGISADNIVLWAESHDTYANDNFTGPSTTASQSQVKKTWAIVAARDFAALYYVRPGSTSAAMGTKSTNTSWKDKEIVAVNQFHNQFNGQKEYMSSYDNSVAIVERGTTGVVLVNISGGSKSVSNCKMNLMKDGVYTDQVTGSKFTVSGGKISGQIGSTGVAVVYEPTEVVKKPSADVSIGSSDFSSNTLSVTITPKNADSVTYKLGSASEVTITAATTITIGEGMSAGDSVKLVVTAKKGTESNTETYTYNKVDSRYVYIKAPSGWKTTVYCYIYDDSVSPVLKNGVWPGAKMTYRSETGYYKIEVPAEMKTPKIIFSDGTNQYPAANKPGLELTYSSMIYEDGSWKQYVAPVTNGTVTVKYEDEAGNKIAEDVTITDKVGTAYKTSAKTIEGYKLKTFTNNVTGVITKEDIIVKYVYEKNSNIIGWNMNSGKWSYYYEDGSLAKGWAKISGKWFYFDSEGIMQTGWVKVSGKWYYLKSSGIMQTGWVKISGKWYYLDLKSGVMKTGWQKINGAWYYFKASGAMAANEWIGKYYVNANGVWVE